MWPQFSGGLWVLWQRRPDYGGWLPGGLEYPLGKRRGGSEGPPSGKFVKSVELLHYPVSNKWINDRLDTRKLELHNIEHSRSTTTNITSISGLLPTAYSAASTQWAKTKAGRASDPAWDHVRNLLSLSLLPILPAHVMNTQAGFI